MCGWVCRRDNTEMGLQSLEEQQVHVGHPCPTRRQQDRAPSFSADHVAPPKTIHVDLPVGVCAAENLETLLQTRAGGGLRDASRQELLDNGEIFLLVAHPGRVSGTMDRVDLGLRVAPPELGAHLRRYGILIRLQN